MKEYVERFRMKQEKDKSKNTVKAYMSDLKNFMDFLEERNIEFSKVNTQVIDEYIECLFKKVNKASKKKISPKTVNRHLVSIKLFINFLNIQEDYINKIFIEIKTLKLQNHYYLEDLLSKNEFVRLVSKAKSEGDERAAIMFMTLYYTGARVSEMISFKPSDMSEIEETLTILGKGSKYRKIILADDIIDFLGKYISKNKISDHELIFPISRQTVHKTIKKYAGLCRINLKHASAHKFRHLHAIDLIDNGATIEDVAAELGHSDINTTRIYIKKDKEELKKTVNRLSMNRN